MQHQNQYQEEAIQNNGGDKPIMDNCTGICHQIKTSQKAGRNFYRYENGFKRCTQCRVWTTTPGNRCICCHQLLRSTPRAPKSRYSKQATKDHLRLG